MSKDFKAPIEKLTEYANELSPALVKVLLGTEKYPMLKIELSSFLQKHPELKHSHYLEIIAMAHGYKDYNSLVAYLNRYGVNSMKELEQRHELAERRLRYYEEKIPEVRILNQVLISHNITSIVKELSNTIPKFKKEYAFAIALEYFTSLGDAYLEHFIAVLNEFDLYSDTDAETKDNFKMARGNIIYALSEDYQVKIAKTILSYRDYNQDQLGTALSSSVQKQAYQMVEALLQHNANSNMPHKVMGYAMDTAIYKRDKQMIKVLRQYNTIFQKYSLRACFFDRYSLNKSASKDLNLAKWLLSQFSPEEKEINMQNLHEDFIKQLQLD